MKKILLDLFQVGVVKFGDFTLKSGIKSPIYIDLRPLVSYPKLLNQLALEVAKVSKKMKFDLLAGIPYTALPIAVLVSQKLNKPMIYTRKEVKDYGTKKPIEGVYKKGDRCLVIDDLITTGGSKFETIKPLEEAGMKIKDVLVVLDREQGGKEQLEAKGYRLTSLIKITDWLKFLLKNKKISQQKFKEVMNFLAKTRI